MPSHQCSTVWYIVLHGTVIITTCATQYDLTAQCDYSISTVKHITVQYNIIHYGTSQPKCMVHYWLQCRTNTQRSASGVQYKYTLQYSTCVQCSMPCAHGISTWYTWICKSHYTSLSLHVPPAMCVTYDHCIYMYIHIYIHMYIGPFTRSRSLLQLAIAVSLSLNRHPECYYRFTIG